MRRCLRTLLLLAVLGSGLRGAVAETPGDAPAGADAAVAAWQAARRAGDADGARAVAQARHLDPAAMGAALVATEFRARAPGFETGPVVATLRALRADAGDRGGLAALDRLIARLAEADPPALARERAWVEGAARVRALDLRAPAQRRDARTLRGRLRAAGSIPACYPVWWVEHLAGRALDLGGDEAGALRAYDEAAAYADAGGMAVPAARSYLAAGLALQAAGDLPGAIARGRRSLARAEEAGEPRAIREAVTLLVALHFEAGEGEAALGLVASHMPTPTWQRARDRHLYYLTAFNLQSRLGRPALALATARRMEANARQIGSGAALGEALRSLGHAHDAVGRTAEAIECFEAALAQDLSTRPRTERLVLVGLADIWHRLGRYGDAERAARKALALSRRLGRRDDEAQDLLYLAHALAGAERWTAALESAQASLALSVDLGEARRIGEARREVAALHWRAGEQATALALLEAARASFAGIGDTTGEAYTLWLTGAYRVLRGDHADALVLAERSAALLHPAHGFHARIARLRAAALHGLGRHRESAAAAHAAIETSRRGVQGLAASDTLVVQRSIASAAAYGVLSAYELARQADSTGSATTRWLDEAFWMIESSRALQLNVALREKRARSFGRLPEALVREERATQQGVAAARAHLVATATSTAPDTRAMEEARLALETAWRARDSLVARIERVSRRAGLAAGARPVPRSVLADLLRADEAWIAWTIAKDRVCALVVRDTASHLVDVGARAGIEEDIAAWRRVLATPGGDDTPAARRLYAALVAPLQPHLKGVRRLLVSPGGALASVPLAALVTTRAPAAGRLLEDFELLYVPSATSYAILVSDPEPEEPRDGLLVVAAPAYDGTGLPALPHTTREAKLVGEAFRPAAHAQLTGEAASVQGIRAHLDRPGPGLRALHVAAHAFVDPEHPDRNGIVLAGGDMLTVDRVRRMRMPSDLVVLSCCDSGRGTPTAGEGQRGLVRAFLVAGARRVVASCWRVSDAETPALMEHLYRGWQGKGLALPSALRAAQLQRLRAGGALAHPYYWAAFVAWGLP